jgi:hypothetical protein
MFSPKPLILDLVWGAVLNRMSEVNPLTEYFPFGNVRPILVANPYDWLLADD